MVVHVCVPHADVCVRARERCVCACMRREMRTYQSLIIEPKALGLALDPVTGVGCIERVLAHGLIHLHDANVG